MPIDKLIPQYLNLDDDERILKSYEMVDALNVRISHEEDGDAGVIKNVEGNRIIPPKNAVEDALPSTGRNRCVGVCTSEAHKCVYFFIYNSEDSHGIYRYIAAPGSEDSNVFEKVYENSVLNFNDTAYINADLIVNQDAEHLLYFTDDRNEPRKINATRALSGGYNTYINTGTIAQKEDFLAVCKKPPLIAPILEFLDNPKRKVNRIRNSLFQFAYQYIYDDGEYSALSPASVLAISPRHLSSQGDPPFTDTKYNEIKVTLQNSKGPVKKLILYVRNGNSGYYSRVKELDNSDVISTQDFVFANDGIYVQASDADTQKTFDTVPQRAGAQVFSNNRLFYGNYVEGFDNLTPNTIMNPVLHPAGANLSTVDVLLPPGGQLDGPRLLPSALDKFRLALGPDNEDWENIELFGSPDTQTILQETIDDLSSIGALELVANGQYYALQFAQLALWRSGLDALVPDTKKSFGGGNLTATSGVLHDTAGGNIVSQSNLANPSEQSGNYSMKFEIDLSGLPTQGFSGETTAAVRLDVSGSSIGTANNNTSGQYYTTEIECLGDDGGVLSHTPTSIRYLQKKNTSFDYDTDYDNYKQVQHCGNFSSLSIQSGLQFSAEVDLSNKTEVQAGDTLAAALKGQSSRMFVKSAKYSDYGPRDRWRGTNALKGEGPDGNFHFAECPANAYRAEDVPGVSEGKQKDQSVIYLSWSGFYTFIVRNAQYDPAAKKITGVLTPTELKLEADEGLVGKFNTGTNPKKYNHFLKDSSNVDDRKAHSDSYTDAFVRCGVTVGESVLNRAGIVTAINEFSVDGDVEIVNSSSIEDMFTLKSGANHEFGIVYFDERGRHGGVQRLGAVEIPHLYDAVRTSDIGEPLFGKAEVDIRLKHQPPVWATKWSPVYAGNSTYDFYLYTGVAEAFVPIKNLKRDIRSTSEDTEDSINNSAVIMQGLGGDVSSAIFLSMRTLEGKPNSAKELLGSMKTYQYQEGDRLRIVEYVDSEGRTIRPDVEIPITGYQYLIDDENNPLKPASEGTDVDDGPKDDIYRTTGWFLSVKNPKKAGFRREDVASGVDLWSQNCKVQIVRYKKNTENPVYYEIGKMYDVSGPGQVARTHDGDFSSQLIQDAKVVRDDAFTSSTRCAVGDRVADYANPSILTNAFGTIKEVRPRSGGGFLYVLNPKCRFTGASINSVHTVITGVSNEDVITIKSGDAYLKLRRQIVNAKEDFEPELSPGTVMTYNPTIPREAQYSTFVVEDDSVSDFFESNSYTYGRAHAENIEQSQMRRVSSITYSDPFAFDSNRLALSSFNPTLFPYKDMPSKYGEVTALVDGNESLTCLQESKVSMVPVNRNVVEMGGDSSMVTSTDVLGTAMFMAGEFGPGVTKDGVVNRFGQLYFSDVRAGRVCRIDGSGITPISEIKMESYFEGLFGGVNNCVAKPKIPSGFDPENGEYIVTTEPINFSKLVQDESTVGFCPTPEDNMVFDDIIGTPTFSRDMLLSWGTEKMEWDEVDELDPNNEPAFEPYLPMWREMHQGTIYIDRITERSGIYIDPEFENPIQGSTILDVIKIDVVDQLKTVRGFFRISLKDFTIDAKTEVDPDEADNKLVTLLRTTSGAGDPTTTLTIAPVVDPDKATVAWSPTAEKWLTFYSFIPEMYANIQNRFFSFKDGKMWQHNMSPVRNSFYEETEDTTKRYPSRLRLISRGNPSSVKAYKALSTEGNRAWGVKLRNDTQRTADIEASHFHLKEGMRYANIPRVTDNDLTNAEGPDENLNDIPSTAYRIIGTVESVNFDRITFTSDVSNTPIITGPSAKVVKFTPGTDEGWQNTAQTWKIEGLVSGSRTEVNTTLNGAFTDIQPGDFIANVYTTGVDGDMFRGYYAQLTLENSESKDDTYTGPIEFYAANMVYDASSLHNDGGQPNNQ